MQALWTHHRVARLVTAAFELEERLAGYPVERRRFRAFLGRNPNLRKPRTFNDKVVWSKLHTRDPLIAETASKLGLRAYAKRVLGADAAQRVLVPLLHETNDPRTIPFTELPPEYVLKPNHASGWLLFQTVAAPVSEKVMLQTCQRWMRSRFGLLTHEWPYATMPRRILVEPLLRDESGMVPRDYKLFMFHGRCRMIQVDHDRFGQHTRTCYDETYQPIKVWYRYPVGPQEPAPPTLPAMLELAQALAQPFGFVRVDLYTMGNRVYLGELTHWPVSGHGRFDPASFDEWLGSLWQLP